MRLGGRLAAAIEILEDMETRRRPVADALKDWGLSHRFAGSGDRAAIGNFVYDVLRRKRSLAWRIGDERPASLVVAALLAESVQTADSLRAALDGDRFAPALPDGARLERVASADLREAPDAIRADVPDWLAAPLEASLGPDWIADAEALAARPPLDLRVNTLKATREAVAAALADFAAAPTAIAATGLRIPPIEGEGRHPNVQVEGAFQTGLFEIQDEGSQVAAGLADAQPGQTVLDYCAGAGGKTLALAALMGNDGRLHAYDADRQRLAPIWERVARAGATLAEIHAPRSDLSGLRGTVDRVVVDAPCTGSGTWRRRPDAKWRLTEGQLLKRTAEQDKVLDAAVPFVRPGGHLAYITCSVLRAENAERIEAFLRRNPAFAPLDAEDLWASNFPRAGRRYRAEPIGEGSALTLTPRVTGTDGFFFASLVRR